MTRSSSADALAHTPNWKLRSGTAAILAGIALLASGQVLAADSAASVSDLQIENARLRAEIEALKKKASAAPVAPAVQATPAAAIGDSASSTGTGTYDPNSGVTALDRIVVTSRNREEIAQDVPLPVVVIGGEKLDREDIKTIWDLPYHVPNLQLNPAGENARKVSPSIRGLGRGGANDSMEQSVSTIVDGVTLYYSGQAWSDYVDLDRIEVLNGPQGTLQGKNSSLGAINIVTKAPSFTKASSYEISTGDLNSLNGKFSSTGPLVDGKLAYRGTFVVDRSDGIYTNTYQSFGHAKETWRENAKLAGRFQLLWTPNEDLSGRFIFDKLRSDERVNTGNVLVSNGPANNSNGTARTVYTVLGGYVPTGGVPVNYGLLGRWAQRSAWFHNADGSVYQPKLNTTDIENSEARPQVTNQYGSSAQFDWRVNDHTLTSITAYRYQDFDIKNGGQNGQFYIGNSGQQLWNQQFSQEFRIASTPAPDKVLDYQAGLYYLKARVYSDDPSYYGPDAGAWNATNAQFTTLIGSAAGRQLMRASLDGYYQSIVTDARVRSVAAYGQADWHVTNKATLSFGARRTQEEKKNSASQQLDRGVSNYSDLIALNTSLGLAANSAEYVAAKAIRDASIKAPYAFADGASINAGLTAWNISPSYKLNDDTLLYTSLGQGIKSGFIFFHTSATLPGAVALPGAAGTFQNQIKPEKVLDFELGFKSLLLDRKLQFNTNLYITKITDYQASWRRDDGTGTNTSVSGWGNVEKIGAKGLELQSIYQHTSQLSFNANAAFNQAKYETPWLVQVPEISATTYTDAKGQQVAGVPKTSINYGLNYQAPIGGFLGRVTLSNSYRSETYLNDNHSDFTKHPAYTLTNLGFGLGALNRTWEVSLLGRNVFNKEYYTNLGTWSNGNGSGSSAPGAATSNPGAPRNWQLVFKAKL